MRVPRRQEPAGDAREHRNRQRKRQHAYVDRDGVQSRKSGRQQRRQRLSKARGERESRDGSAQPDDGVLHQQLSDDAALSRADGRAHRHLAPAGRRARELQARDVGRCGDQQERDGCEQHEDCRPDVRGHRLKLRHGRHVDRPCRAEQRSRHESHVRRAARARRGFSGRLRRRDANTQTGDCAEDDADQHAALAVHRRHAPRRPRARVAIRECELTRHHADDRVWFVVELKELPRHLRTSAEPFLPEAVREDHGSCLAARAFVFVEESSEQRTNSQNWKEARCRRDDRQAHRIAAAGHCLQGNCLRQPAAEILDRRRMISPGQVGTVRHRAGHAPAATLARFGHAQQSFRVGPRQRLQQYAVRDAEQHRGRPDAERHRENRDGREARLTPEEANAVSQILHKLSMMYQHARPEPVEGLTTSGGEPPI